MARIRTVKPEMFESESLAECSVTAMLTFIGLLTQADDSGRHRDHPAIIAGRLWALRPEHTAAHVAQDLEELAAAGLICRYTGCDGRTWLHVMTWEQHQKINKPTASRVPRCPSHQGHHPCGKCQTRDCPTRIVPSMTPPGTLPNDSGSPQRGVHRPVPTATQSAGTTADPGEPVSVPLAGLAAPTAATPTKSPGQRDLPDDSRRTTGGLREDSRSGSRILDPGSFLTGREAPAPDAVPGSVSAKELVAEYIRDCQRRPPEDFLGLLGRKIKALLDERFDPQDIGTALERLRAKGLHPSVLPSLVNEVVNAAPQAASVPSSASGAGPWASTSGYTPYLNPTEPTTFGGRL
ncbi:hypothetical protein ACKI1I_28225 [Streptomyces turgidiscabies]|uniref:hypothetical protein n=1 Tax=Streptomyces turgidiscabies TaxID=85558 RepID=UPI0038F7B40F